MHTARRSLGIFLGFSWDAWDALRALGKGKLRESTPPREGVEEDGDRHGKRPVF